MPGGFIHKVIIITLRLPDQHPLVDSNHDWSIPWNSLNIFLICRLSQACIFDSWVTDECTDECHEKTPTDLLHGFVWKKDTIINSIGESSFSLYWQETSGSEQVQEAPGSSFSSTGANKPNNHCGTWANSTMDYGYVYII
jgi:hypothetical protein